MLSDWETKIPVGSLKPWFIMVQFGEILDVVSRPSLLQGWVDGSDFSILIGTLNEFGNHEILGPCGEYFHIKGENSWLVTSPMDGCARLVGITGSVAEFIISRLSTLYKNNHFEDLINFPQVGITGFVCSS